MATWEAGERIVADKLSTYAGEPEIREANTATFTTTNLQQDSITVPLVSGRRYKVVWDGEFQSTVIGDSVRAELREDSSTGTIIQLRQTAIDKDLQAYPNFMQTFYTATATGDKTFVVVARRIDGTGTITGIANSQSPTLFYVENA